MKKTTPFLLLFILLVWSACDKNDPDPGYTGKNEISLTPLETNTMIDEEGAILSIDLMLTHTPDHEVELTFRLDGHTQNGVELVSLQNAKIVIPANQKTARIEIVSNNKGMLVSGISVQLSLAASSANDISLTSPFSFTVKPGKEMPSLTEDQEALLKGYEEKGWSIRQWLGMVPVKVTVDFPGGTGYAPLDQPYTREINGKTTITLSESASEGTPILKMTSNAMGIADYLHEIVRGETILNNDYWWNATPNAKTAIRLLEMTTERAEEFDTALDNLALDTESNTIDFVSENLTMENFYPEISPYPIYENMTIVNFDYTYSVWNRMKKLIDEENQEMKTCYSEGGTLHPTNFLNYSSINTDEYEANNNWIYPASSFDFSTGELSFVFCMDYPDAMDYIRFTVTYSPAK